MTGTLLAESRRADDPLPESKTRPMRRSDKEITNRDQLEAIIRGSLVCRLALAKDNVPINNGEGNASVRDERWYFIRYQDGTEEFYDMERDPMQWTNLATSKIPKSAPRSRGLRLRSPLPLRPMLPPKRKTKATKRRKPETLT